MVSNKNSDHRKCGDILINVRTIRNKAKQFTYHCALCSIDCDQLKKFSKHMENHLNCFDNDLESGEEQFRDKLGLIEPEKVKVENIELIRGCEIPRSAPTSEEYDDPLETEKFYKNELKKSYSEDLCMENIKNEDTNKVETENCKNEISKTIEKDVVEVAKIEESKRNIQYSHSITTNDFSSDDLSDFSIDSDYDVNKEVKSSKNMGRTRNIEKRRGSARRLSNILNNINKNNPINNSTKGTSRRSRTVRKVIIDKFLPILIQQYKKHKILWQVDDIAFGVRNKKIEVYQKIAEELKLETSEIVNVRVINHHIKHLNELYSKDKKQELKCQLEKRKFLPEYEYYKELSFLSSSQGPFLCMICNEILPKYQGYCHHKAEHNETQPFKCPSCERTFTNYHKYLIHKKRHLKVHDFHCTVCGKGYLFKNDLEWHVTSHTGEKPYLCQICGISFRARHGYDNHIRRHEKRFRHECHICKRGFNQLHALNNHVKSHLNIRDVICTICGKGFVHTKYLKRHELIHGKEKRYKCNECGKDFFQACGLRAHRKKHHPYTHHMQ